MAQLLHSWSRSLRVVDRGRSKPIQITAEKCASTSQGLKRHALFLDLLDPCCGSLFRLVAFIVLIEWAPQELASLIALRFAVSVATGVDVTDQLSSSRCKGRMQFLDAIAEVLTIGPRIADTENGNRFATEVNVLDFVDKVIPSSA